MSLSHSGTETHSASRPLLTNDAAISVTNSIVSFCLD